MTAPTEDTPIPDLMDETGLLPQPWMQDDTQLREAILKALWAKEPGERIPLDVINRQADDILALFTTAQIQLVSELEGRLPPKSLALRKMYETDKEYYANLGYNAAIDQTATILEHKKQELEGKI